MRAAPRKGDIGNEKVQSESYIQSGFGATFDGEFLTEKEARQFLLDNVPGLEKNVTCWGDDYWLDKLGQIYLIVWEY